MPDISALIGDWQQRGIALLVDGEKLVSRARPGAIDAATAATIRAHKDDIVALLRERGRDGAGVLDGRDAYWRAQLRDLPHVHAIPLDGPRPPAMPASDRVLEQDLSGAAAARVRALAQAHDTGVETVLQCIVALALCRWSRSDELVLGNGAGLPLRIALRPDQTLGEHIVRTRDLGRAAAAHAGLAPDALAALAEVVPGASHAALFQVGLAMQTDPAFTGLDLSIHATHGTGEAGAAHADEYADVYASEYADEQTLRLTWRAPAALFHEATLRGMMACVARLLEPAGADAAVGSVQLAGAHDIARQAQWNCTAVAGVPAACLHTLVERQAALTPQRLALACGADRLSYRDVNDKANALAAQLSAAGVRQGGIVAVVMQPGLAVPLSFLAIMKAGAAFAPLDADWPAARLRAALARLGEPVVLADAGADGEAADAGWVALDWRRLGRAADPALAVGPDAPIYVMHTSGSMGEPKGALNLHRGVVNRLAFMNRYFGARQDEVVLQTTHHCFDSAVWQFFWPMINGGCSVMPRFGAHFDLDHIVHLLRAHAVTLTDFSPALLSVLADHLGAANDTGAGGEDAGDRAAPGRLALRELVVGGEEMTAAIARKCAAALPGVGLHNFYGVSEASIGCVHYRLPAILHGAIPIGRPIDNVVVFLADPQLQAVPVGAVGEILLGGDCVGLGYVGLPAQSAAAFIELDRSVSGSRRFYRTGDLGRYRADGALEFLGRIDAQVKLRGFRIELGEITAAIEALPQMRQAHVLLTGEAPHRQLTACLVPSAPIAAHVLRAQVGLALAARLPAYMLPSRYLVLDRLPLSPSGKVDRRTLVRLAAADQERAQPVAPADRTEATLVAIWAELLKVAPGSISTTDNFFEIGGHSLLCIALQSAIGERLGHAVTVADLFLYPTIGHVSRFIAGGFESAPADPALAPVAAGAPDRQNAKARIRRARKGGTPPRQPISTERST